MMQLCGFEVGLDRPLFLIAGPCVIESEQLALDTAGASSYLIIRYGAGIAPTTSVELEHGHLLVWRDLVILFGEFDLFDGLSLTFDAVHNE
jgi:hypothetical protein